MLQRRKEGTSPMKYAITPGVLRLETDTECHVLRLGIVAHVVRDADGIRIYVKGRGKPERYVNLPTENHKQSGKFMDDMSACLDGLSPENPAWDELELSFCGPGDGEAGADDGEKTGPAVARAFRRIRRWIRERACPR
jgi:hypothetical protein